MQWLNGNNKITILNKLSAKDNPSKKDIWYKTILNGCVWVNNIERKVENSDAILTHSVTVRIPKNPHYKIYNEWKNKPDTDFTLNPGDFIILGDITETITEPIVDIVNKYKPNSIQIKEFRDNSNIDFIPHYRIEGV